MSLAGHLILSAPSASPSESAPSPSLSTAISSIPRTSFRVFSTRSSIQRLSSARMSSFRAGARRDLPIRKSRAGTSAMQGPVKAMKNPQ